MFNVGSGELLVILVLALIVLGPDKLPEAIRKVGRIYGELRRMSNGFQAELRDVLDEPLREVRSTTDMVRTTFGVVDDEPSPPVAVVEPPSPPAEPFGSEPFGSEPFGSETVTGDLPEGQDVADHDLTTSADHPDHGPADHDPADPGVAEPAVAERAGEDVPGEVDLDALAALADLEAPTAGSTPTPVAPSAGAEDGAGPVQGSPVHRTM